MITEGDTQDIVYSIVKSLGLPVIQGDTKNYSSKPRVVVHAHKQEREKQWMKNFLEVNVVMPDVANEAQRAKLKEYETQLKDMFYEDTVGTYKGSGYLIELQSLGIEEDTTLKSHFVNCKLLFSTLR